VIPWVTSTLSDPSVGIYSITLQILRVGTSPTPINAPHHQHQPLSTQFLPIFRPFSRPFTHVPPRSHLLHSTHCHSGRCDSPLGLTLRSYSGTRTDHHCRGPAAPAVLLKYMWPHTLTRYLLSGPIYWHGRGGIPLDGQSPAKSNPLALHFPLATTLTTTQPSTVQSTITYRVLLRLPRLHLCIHHTVPSYSTHCIIVLDVHASARLPCLVRLPALPALHLPASTTSIDLPGLDLPLRPLRPARDQSQYQSQSLSLSLSILRTLAQLR
jgi:hypothetical protein